MLATIPQRGKREECEDKYTGQKGLLRPYGSRIQRESHVWALDDAIEGRKHRMIQ